MQSSSAYRREDIVEEEDVAVAIDRPGQTHPGLLAPGEVDPPLPDLGGIPRGEGAEIRTQCAALDRPAVALFIDGLLTE